MNRDLKGTNFQPPTGLERYLRHRPVYSALLLGAVMTVTGVARVVTSISDVRQWNLSIAAWELAVWESTSIVVILALMPAMLFFDRHVPITWQNWRRALPKHLLASMVYSVVHVEAMLLLRKLIYSFTGRQYTFDSWFGQLLYEYLKDVRTYFALLIIVYSYRFILLRLQGEASELNASEEESIGPRADYSERFLVRKLDREFLVSADEIEWLEAEGNYVNLHVKRRAYPLRSTMAAIESRLDPAKFVRVHRSHIVNLEFLAEIEPLESGDARLKLRDGTAVQCSRTYRAELKGRLSTPAESQVPVQA